MLYIKPSRSLCNLGVSSSKLTRVVSFSTGMLYLSPKCIHGSMELVGELTAGASSIALDSVEGRNLSSIPSVPQEIAHLW